MTGQEGAGHNDNNAIVCRHRHKLISDTRRFLFLVFTSLFPCRIRNGSTEEVNDRHNRVDRLCFPVGLRQN